MDIKAIRSIWDQSLSLPPEGRIEINVADVNEANTIRGMLYKEKRAYERTTGIDSHIRIARDMRTNQIVLTKLTPAANPSVRLVLGDTMRTIDISPNINAGEPNGGAPALPEQQQRILDCMVEDGWDRSEATEFLLNG